MKSESCSDVSNSLPHHGLPSPWNPIDQNTGVGSLSFLQGIFPTQGSNPGLPHCRGILYQLSHKGSPRVLEWVAYPISSGSSPPRDRAGVSCISSGFLTNWAVGEAIVKVSLLHWHVSQVWISESLSLISFLPLPLSLWQSPICSLHLLLCFSFVICFHLFCFSDSTHKWNHMMLVFLWLIFLHIIPSGSTRVVTDGKFFFFFFTAWVSFHFICVCVSVWVCVCVCVCMCVYFKMSDAFS